MAACPERSKSAILRPGTRPLLTALWRQEGSYRRHLARNETLFRAGEPADSLYIVEDGVIKLSIGSSSGKDLTVGLFGPGEILGEEVVAEPPERAAYGVALDRSVIVAVPRARVRLALERDRDVAVFLARLLAARIRDTALRLEELAWSTVSARLASAILRLGQMVGVDEHAGISIGVRITHQEIANLIGSTRETTTATLNDFRRRGWVDFARHRIVILRHDLLERAAAERN
jgi:CRP/FNR family transcriptional regulator